MRLTSNESWTEGNAQGMTVRIPRFVCRLLAVFLATALLPSALSAQSILNFPRVISSDQVFTGLAVGNPTPGAVTVTFTAYGADGILVTGGGVENSTTKMIAAGGQLARQYSELFGSADFNGWVQATSVSRGLTGFFLNANPAVTDLDGAVALAAAVDFVLPFAAEDATEKTELTVVNPGDETATATLTLPAKTLTRQTLGVVFPGAELQTASYVVVQGDRALVAHEIVANFQVAGTAFRRETIALGGRRPTGSTRQILPQFVTGAGWLSFLGLVNTAAIPQDVVLTARMDDGTEWDLPENPKTVTLDANGGWRGTVTELFGITDGSGRFRAGWIDIATPVGFLTSYIGFGNEATASFALVGGVEDTAASKLQMYSQVAEGGGFFTGLTVVNPSGSEATVEFFTLLPDGTTVGKATLMVPENGRVGRLYRELLPASLGQVGGGAYLRSSVEVVGAALFGGTNGFALASVPAESIAADFIPPAQVAAAITGMVRQDGVGVDDVTVSLTGPVTATTKTDAEGRYILAQLPAGTYTLSASRLGAQVVPAERTVELGLENVNDEDFTAGGGGALRSADSEFHHSVVDVRGDPVNQHDDLRDELLPVFGGGVQRDGVADEVRQHGRVDGAGSVERTHPRECADHGEDTAAGRGDVDHRRLPGDRGTGQPVDRRPCIGGVVSGGGGDPPDAEDCAGDE